MDEKLDNTNYELINKISFFDQFTEEEKRYFADLDKLLLRYRPSDFIINEGEIDSAFFVLLKGVVCVIKSKPKETIITKLKAGAIFGEIAVVGQRPRTTGVVANGDAIAMRIELNEVKKLPLNIQTKLKDQLIGILANRLEIMNDQWARFIR
jgi:CRP/FNR family transcriptional regulator, cyclic AMP receptor protein